jgi:predicted transcriptional regulator
MGEKGDSKSPRARLSVILLVHVRRRVNTNHRGHLDIIADILDASGGGVRKTYLMYRCNLSFRQLKQYSGFLMNRGLLCINSQEDNMPHGRFEVTDKGKQFLKAYRSLIALMN